MTRGSEAGIAPALIAPLPEVVRRAYHQTTGVWIAGIPAIIDFYADGGMKTESGEQIRVPRWVMMRGVARSPVLVEVPPEAIPDQASKSNGTVVAAGFRLLCNFLFRETNSPFIDRGQLTISPGGVAASMTWEVVLSGKNFRRVATAAGNCALTIGLTDCPQDARGTIIGRIASSSSATGAADSAATVTVEFRDLRPATGKPGADFPYYAIAADLVLHPCFP